MKTVYPNFQAVTPADQELLAGKHCQSYKEFERERKKHLELKHGSHNVVGECEDLVSKGAVKVKDPARLEAEDELAANVRREKQDAKMRLCQQEREAKDKLKKEA